MLPKEFLVNLADEPLREAVGRRCCWTEDRSRPPPAATAPRRRPRATAPSRRRRVVRAIITDDLTDASDRGLMDREGREKIKKKILKSIKKHTDVHAEEVLFPDVTVQ